jgi:hypothetical protein
LSANSGSARRMARKNAPPGWRAHLGWTTLNQPLVIP